MDLLNHMLGHGSVNAALEDANVISHDSVTVAPDTPLESLMNTFSSQSVVIVKDGDEVRDIITKIDVIDFLANAV